MKYTTANEFIKLKLKRNELMINLLEMENKVAKLEMVIRLRILRANTLYIINIKKINDIERKQLYTYDIGRENQVKELTSLINSNDIPISDLKKDIIALAPKFIEIMNSIQNINSSMPEYIQIINYFDDPILEHKKKCGF